VFLEFGEVEPRLFGERIVDVGEEVERQQAARVVGAERNLAAGVGRDGHEAFVGIAVGDAFADDRIPEQHARLGRLPGVVDDLFPQLAGVDVLLVGRIVGSDGELLMVFLAGNGGTHEVVVDLDRDVGARDLAGIDLGVDETLGIGVLDRQREHQGSAPAVLRHLARGIGIAFHERYDARRREGRVEYRAARRTDVREVVAYAAAPLHELHLLLVHAEDAAVGVGRVLVADDEAVGERGHLEVVADAGHGAALGNDVAEMVEQIEYLVRRHGRGVFALDARDLGGDALVHLPGRTLVDVAERILEGILGDPHRGGQVVAVEVDFRFGHGVVVVDLLRCRRIGNFCHNISIPFLIVPFGGPCGGDGFAKMAHSGQISQQSRRELYTNYLQKSAARSNRLKHTATAFCATVLWRRVIQYELPEPFLRFRLYFRIYKFLFAVLVSLGGF